MYVYVYIIITLFPLPFSPPCLPMHPLLFFNPQLRFAMLHLLYFKESEVFLAYFFFWTFDINLNNISKTLPTTVFKYRVFFMLNFTERNIDQRQLASVDRDDIS